MKHFFITASGTNIGKTFITTALCWQLRQQGKSVTALKPVMSGYDPNDPDSDSALILKSCGVTPTPNTVEVISPWRYQAALAPNMAAAREGSPVDMEALIAYCREHATIASDILLVEGVGGVMAPVTDSHTVLDWMEALQWPSIMVVGSYLGAISHALTAIEAMKLRKMAPSAIVINQSEGSEVSFEETASTLEKFLPETIPVVKVPRLRPQEDLWTQVPLISWVCDI